jgi:oligoribonuclease NrnB/cAMP/cGMP phosphodiesterase (DHH superfamily)
MEHNINSKILKNLIVFYHGECSDGFAGAWAAWKKLGDEADYFGMSFNQNPPADLFNKKIYFIDFVFSKEIMEELKNNNNKIIIIDHHKTSEDILKLADEKYFDLEHSGAILAWNYFHPQEVAPKILQHIEDRDLWNWSLENSREILNYLDLFDLNFNTWDDIIGRYEYETLLRKEFVENGKIIQRYFDFLCHDIIEKGAVLVEFEGYKIYAVNAPHVFANEVGNILRNKYPPLGIVWQIDKEGNCIVSLRSDESVDVAEIAKKYNGGGHAKAAGFRIPGNQSLPWKILK